MSAAMTVRANRCSGSVAAAPPDPILGLTEKFNADTNPQKVNLGVGVYQDASGKAPLLRAVHEAETRLLEKEGAKTYLPIDGMKTYNQAVQTLLFGADSPVVSEGSRRDDSGAGRNRGAENRGRFPEAVSWRKAPRRFISAIHRGKIIALCLRWRASMFEPIPIMARKRSLFGSPK